MLQHCPSLKYVPIAFLLLISACDRDNPAETGTHPDQASQDVKHPVYANVDAERVINADKDPGNWLSHGRTYDEQRYSPLKNINIENVDQLGLAWYFDLETTRGTEATPLVIDGVMYVPGHWNVVFAIDAASGHQRWRYDPHTRRDWTRYACCDAVSRGLAAWKGKIIAATLDGRVLALDARSGELVWEVQTTDPDQPYSITGAPRVVNGKVVIGNNGAELGIRGYVTAYDAETGEQIWRFYTVPANPADGFESPAMEMAAKTWSGEWWKYGGGGTAWDSFSYDPELNLRYIGTGNGRPWPRDIRSPGGGDNRFWLPLSPSTPIPGSIAGITRPFPARTGTSPPLNT
jgi:quinohemoprotein ethanol dehydrogenase